MTMTCKELVEYLEKAMAIVGEDTPVYIYDDDIENVKCDVELTENTKAVRII